MNPFEAFADDAFRNGFFCAFSLMTVLFAICGAVTTAINARAKQIADEMERETAEWEAWARKRPQS